MKVIVADDSLLVREAVTSLLTDAGHDVVATVADAPSLLRETALTRPDAAVVDIRMPPTHTDEGLRAAERVRIEHPAVAVMVLSQYIEPGLALRLLAGQERSTGYLLKERVTDAASFVADLRRLVSGETVIDPELVREMIAEGRHRAPVDPLTGREWAVLQLIAEGRTDRGIADALCVSQKTVESHVGAVFRKLELPSSPSDNRRVHAALWYLRGRS